MSQPSVICHQIREDVVRDPHHPVHKIADQLLPYLHILVEQFHPEQVILFGSYANGQPTCDSDVDLLLVKPIREGRVKDKVAIRSAWWPFCLARPHSPLTFFSPLRKNSTVRVGRTLATIPKSNAMDFVSHDHRCKQSRALASVGT